MAAVAAHLATAARTGVHVGELVAQAWLPARSPAQTCHSALTEAIAPATGPAAAHREALDADFATLNEARARGRNPKRRTCSGRAGSAAHRTVRAADRRRFRFCPPNRRHCRAARCAAGAGGQRGGRAGGAAVRDHPGGCPRGARKAVGAAYPGGNNERGRDVMWCSATGDADRWPPPGSLVIADLAQQTRDEHLKLTLLDSGSTRWPPGPSARLLTLLESDLPWTISLTDRAGHSAQPEPAATRP